MKLVELLWLAVFALLAAILSKVDCSTQGGRLLGLGLVAGGWAVLGVLIATGVISFSWGATLAAVITGAAVLGSLVGAARDRLVCVKVPAVSTPSDTTAL